MNQETRGFTVIEVSLVLAIAGLIFLMAFIALPALWASQRDSERKGNILEIVSDIKNYQTNNSRGALPIFTGTSTSTGFDNFSFTEARSATDSTSWRAFVKGYVASDFSEPAGGGIEYKFYPVKCLNSSGREISTGETCAHNKLNSVNASAPDKIPSMDYTIYMVVGATCDGDHAVKTNSSRSVAVVYIMERAGRYCANT